MIIRWGDVAFQHNHNLNIHLLLDLLLLSRITYTFSHLLHIAYRINCCFSDIWLFFLLIIKAICVHCRESKKSVRRAERRKQNATTMSSFGEQHSFTLKSHPWPGVQRQRQCNHIKCEQRVHKQCHNSIQFSGSFCWFAFFL